MTKKKVKEIITISPKGTIRKKKETAAKHLKEAKDDRQVNF